MNKTLMFLMMEYETPVVPLKKVHEKYFGIENTYTANKRAKDQDLPVPVFRMGSNKSEWLVRLEDLAFYIDKQAEETKKVWEKMQRA